MSWGYCGLGSLRWGLQTLRSPCCCRTPSARWAAHDLPHPPCSPAQSHPLPQAPSTYRPLLWLLPPLFLCLPQFCSFIHATSSRKPSQLPALKGHAPSSDFTNCSLVELALPHRQASKYLIEASSPCSLGFNSAEHGAPGGELHPGLSGTVHPHSKFSHTLGLWKTVCVGPLLGTL